MAIKRNAKDMLSMLKFVSAVLNKMQSVNCSLSNLVIIWKILKETLKDSSNCCKKIFNKWYVQAVTLAHFLAYFLDPNLEVQCLKVNEEDQVLNCGETSLLSILLKSIVCSPLFNGTSTKNLY